MSFSSVSGVLDFNLNFRGNQLYLNNFTCFERYVTIAMLGKFDHLKGPRALKRYLYSFGEFILDKILETKITLKKNSYFIL